jgi:hypothetical protein
MKIKMDPEVLQMLNKISYPGIPLDLGDFELFRQTIVNHTWVKGVLVPIKSMATTAALPLSFLSIS